MADEWARRVEVHCPDLAGKVAIVTGSGTGIGAEIALTLAREGCAVVVGSRAAERLTAVTSAIRDRGGRVLPYAGDLRDAAVVEALVGATIAEFGAIDVLVNNAGGTFNAPAESITPNGWRSVIETNLTSAFLMSRAAFEPLRRSRGSIVNIASIAAVEVPGPQHLHYSVAKAGLVHMTKSLAFEWGAYGIRVNCICPGVIKTPRSVFQGKPDMEEAWRRRVPLRRLGRPEDIAEAVVMLASAASSYTTGAVIRIDGGPRSWPAEKEDARAEAGA